VVKPFNTTPLDTTIRDAIAEQDRVVAWLELTPKPLIWLESLHDQRLTQIALNRAGAAKLRDFLDAAIARGFGDGR
jgi:hypothetical protein